MQVNIDGININYVDEGSGSNVLLLHGWGGSIQTVLPIQNILKNQCRVVALDLPGFGKSDAPDKPWDSYDYAELIHKFIECLGMKDIILFGHSHGGRIAIILTSKYKKLFNKLILIDSAGLIPKRPIKYYLKVYSFKFLKIMYTTFTRADTNKEKLEKFYKKFGSEDYRATDGVMRQTMVKVINDDLYSLLPSIDVPTLLIWGEKDEDTPPYMGKIMEDKIKDSGLIILKGGGHYSYVDCYEQFKAVIKVFLKENL